MEICKKLDLGEDGLPAMWWDIQGVVWTECIQSRGVEIFCQRGQSIEVSVDFITELPESNRRDSIMVVVDSVTKHSHFVSTVTTLLSIRAAQFYVQQVWKHHRLPKRVVSDRGPQCVAEFTREIY